MDSAMRLVGNDYFMPVAMSLLVLALWFSGRSLPELERHQKAVLIAFVAMGLSNLLVKFMNWGFYRPRPFDVLDNVHLLFYRPTDSSLPSNTAVVAFTLVGAVMPFHRRLGTVLLGMALLLSLARIFMGVHFPLDELTGAALGYVSSFAIARLAAKTEPWPSLLLALLRRVFLA